MHCSYILLSAVKLTVKLVFCSQVGLFRKSGVKSRIQALRHMNESSPDNVNYEDQSAYDVADMVKQFFRDLPEPLLTSKLGETFLHIYQCKDINLPCLVSLLVFCPSFKFYVSLGFCLNLENMVKLRLSACRCVKMQFQI